MSLEFSGWLPVKYVPKQRPAKYEQQVIVNWLEMEVDPSAPMRMPVLTNLSGWRNREVYYFVHGYDWTAQMFG